MAGEWIDCTLGDVLTLQRGFDLPAQDRAPGPYPIIASTGVVGVHNEAMVKAPGVVIGRSGSLGGGQYVTRDFWPLNTTLWVKDFKGNDSRFCYYLLKSIDFTEFNVGGAVPTLNRNHIHPHPVRVPSDSDEQRAIAHILGTLDDKIELNCRMNETLEAIARAMFKSWFVDFDPVRAKMSGEPPKSICQRLGLTPDLLALFPDRLVDSELGEIPDGWDVTTLGELCERVSMGPFGSDIKTSNFVDEGVPIIRGGNLTAGFIDDRFVFLTEAKADELRNANARSGDIVITHRGTLGQVGLIPADSRYPRYVVSQSQMVLTVKKEKTTSRFIYEFLCSPTGQYALLTNTSQVGVPAIARPTTSVKAIKLLNPPPKLLNAFEAVVGSLFDHMDKAKRESTTLAILRDTLLPKYLSGELRVPQAELVSEAA
jgi:type I restriction enzyme, S subunit